MTLTPISLKGQLVNLLKDIIGKFSDGSNGVWIDPPYPPAGTPKGLICYIQRSPEQYSSKAASGGLRAITECYVVTLVQYDRTKTTYEAMRLIQKNFLVFSCDVIPAREQDFEQCIIRVKNYGFL